MCVWRGGGGGGGGDSRQVQTEESFVWSVSDSPAISHRAVVGYTKSPLCVRACVRVYVSVCVYVCVCVRLRVRACVCERERQRQTGGGGGDSN